MATLVHFINGPFAGRPKPAAAIDADPLRASGGPHGRNGLPRLRRPSPRARLCQMGPLPCPQRQKTAGPHFYKSSPAK